MNTAAPVFAHLPGWGFAGLALQLNTVLLVAGLVTVERRSVGVAVHALGTSPAAGQVRRPVRLCPSLAAGLGLRHPAVQRTCPRPFREEVIRLSMLDAGEALPQAEPREPAAAARGTADGTRRRPRASRNWSPTRFRNRRACPMPLDSHGRAAGVGRGRGRSRPAGRSLRNCCPALPRAPCPLRPNSGHRLRPARRLAPEPQRLPLAESPPTPTFRISDQAGQASRCCKTTICSG